eukprot:gene3226-biopygen2707
MTYCGMFPECLIYYPLRVDLADRPLRMTPRATGTPARAHVRGRDQGLADGRGGGRAVRRRVEHLRADLVQRRDAHHRRHRRLRGGGDDVRRRRQLHVQKRRHAECVQHRHVIRPARGRTRLRHGNGGLLAADSYPPRREMMTMWVAGKDLQCGRVGMVDTDRICRRRKDAGETGGGMVTWNVESTAVMI